MDFTWGVLLESSVLTGELSDFNRVLDFIYKLRVVYQYLFLNFFYSPEA